MKMTSTKRSARTNCRDAYFTNNENTVPGPRPPQSNYNSEGRIDNSGNVLIKDMWKYDGRAAAWFVVVHKNFQLTQDERDRIDYTNNVENLLHKYWSNPNSLTDEQYSFCADIVNSMENDVAENDSNTRNTYNDVRNNAYDEEYIDFDAAEGADMSVLSAYDKVIINERISATDVQRQRFHDMTYGMVGYCMQKELHIHGLICTRNNYTKDVVEEAVCEIFNTTMACVQVSAVYQSVYAAARYIYNQALYYTQYKTCADMRLMGSYGNAWGLRKFGSNTRYASSKQIYNWCSNGYMPYGLTNLSKMRNTDMYRSAIDGIKKYMQKENMHNKHMNNDVDVKIYDLYLLFDDEDPLVAARAYMDKMFGTGATEPFFVDIRNILYGYTKYPFDRYLGEPCIVIIISSDVDVEQFLNIREREVECNITMPVNVNENIMKMAQQTTFESIYKRLSYYANVEHLVVLKVCSNASEKLPRACNEYLESGSYSDNTPIDITGAWSDD